MGEGIPERFKPRINNLLDMGPDDPSPPMSVSLDPSPSLSNAPAGGSEGRLRAVLTNHSSTSSELRQAIAAVKVLLEEAERELARKEHREMRAAFQNLHDAIDTRDERLLPVAIEEAERTKCDPDDIKRAREILEELLSATSEERRAKELKEIAAEKRRQAFVLVKQDDAPRLQALFDALEPEIRWQDWKNHEGRTLWRFAQAVGSMSVQTIMAPCLGLSERNEDRTPNHNGTNANNNNNNSRSKKNRNRNNRRKTAKRSSDFADSPEGTGNINFQIGEQDMSPSVQSAGSETSASASASPRASSHSRSRLGEGATGPSAEEAFSSNFQPVITGAYSEAGSVASPTSRDSPWSPPQTPAESAEDKAAFTKAKSAVLNNDGSALQEVLSRTDIDRVRSWKNAAGEGLLALSESRHKPEMYAILARAFGMVEERKPQAFEERQDVWVYTQGEVQPKRATILEDSPEEEDHVHIEYWDGDGDPEWIEKSRVRIREA
mmetsp:Transcript_18975/g.40836  ORF Transcript_18975/g.40836 Transcript_18975/m.40836 type:complete len:493 (-) Transcript_18975:48-1526(-)